MVCEHLHSLDEHGYTWEGTGPTVFRSFSQLSRHTVLADRKHPCSGSCPEVGCPPSPLEKPLCILGTLPICRLALHALLSTFPMPRASDKTTRPFCQREDRMQRQRLYPQQAGSHNNSNSDPFFKEIII